MKQVTDLSYRNGFAIVRYSDGTESEVDVMAMTPADMHLTMLQLRRQLEQAR
jgi:hypothetical protein